jgi:hypothetical protein
VGDDEPSAQDVLEAVLATYRELETYRSEGNVVCEGSRGGVDISGVITFRLLLKKPDLYLISASGNRGGEEIEGTMWSDGRQPYLYLGWGSDRKEYYAVRNDRTNLTRGGYLTIGASDTIPDLFFPELRLGLTHFPEDFAKIARIDRVEEVQGEPCYVITGHSDACPEITYWISRSSNFVVKYHRTFDGPRAVKASVEAFETLDPDTQEEVGGRESRMKVWEALKSLSYSSTETHENSSTPELEEADFQFTLPKDAVLKAWPPWREETLEDR